MYPLESGHLDTERKKKKMTMKLKNSEKRKREVGTQSKHWLNF